MKPGGERLPFAAGLLRMFSVGAFPTRGPGFAAILSRRGAQGAGVSCPGFAASGFSRRFSIFSCRASN
jgi:hypothetical protein